jgi:hypothetical protein
MVTENILKVQQQFEPKNPGILNIWQPPQKIKLFPQTVLQYFLSGIFVPAQVKDEMHCDQIKESNKMTQNNYLL